MFFKSRQAPDQPTNEQIQQLTTLFAQNRLDELIEQAGELTKTFPQAAQLYNILSVACNASTDFHEAVTHAEKAIHIQPDYAKAHLNLGNALANLGDEAKAFESYRQAALIAPDFAEAHNNLGVYLIRLNRHAEAVPCLNRALEINPDYPKALNNLGCALLAISQNEQAVNCFERALELNPDYAEASNNLGSVLIDLGRGHDAIACFEKAIALNPGYTEAHRQLTNLITFSENDPHMSAMLELYGSEAISDHQRMHLAFGLFKASEDMGQLEQAFDYLSRGNQLKKELSGYQIETDQALFKRIKSAFSMSQSAQHLAPPACKKSPLFIVGMPRSGTTLIEQILASHSTVHGAGEVDTLSNAINSIHWNEFSVAPDQLQALRSYYLEWLHHLEIDETCVTDKTTINFRWIGFILQAMPEARIIHIKRDARATCWSNFRHYFEADGINFGNDLADISEYYRLYADLMAFWEQRFPGRIHTVEYERLTENQEEETRKLLEYCGLDWEALCLDFHRNKRAVATASNKQVRQKMYQGSSEAWRKYEGWLQPMLSNLGGL